MGSTLSTLLLLAGAIAATVLSIFSAQNVTSQNWDKAKFYAGLTSALAMFLLIMSMLIVIMSQSGLGAMMPGMVAAFILLMLVMIAVSVLEVMAAIKAGDKDSKSRSYSIGSASVSLGGFIVSLLLIILLL